MRFVFTVEVELERESGKFASRDDIAVELVDRLLAAVAYEVDGVGADGDSVYSVYDFEVRENA